MAPISWDLAAAVFFTGCCVGALAGLSVKGFPDLLSSSGRSLRKLGEGEAPDDELPQPQGLVEVWQVAETWGDTSDTSFPLVYYWLDMEPRHSRILSHCWRSGLHQEVELCDAQGRHRWTVDFTSFEQVTESTGNIRVVRRVLLHDL